MSSRHLTTETTNPPKWRGSKPRRGFSDSGRVWERAQRRRAWVVSELRQGHPDMTQKEAEAIYDKVCSP